MPQVGPIEPGPDTIRILITTDNHVGYNENDPVRGDDAWRTFEEIMYIAKDQDVDMVLQSGDLFHINKPSKKSLYHVIKTLRRTCFGDRPCELELLSDPSLVFDDGFNSVNYEDPNLNISIPVFSISGNHDDASGQGLLSPLDLLNVSGLINHFGRVTQSDNINITPLLLQKGLTKLSLFGMASVRDERLFKTFRDGKVKFNLPSIQTDEWFNLMCVHQNHAAHSNTAYLPEHFLPSFLDLVIWGHEHECIPYTVPNATMGFETLQPGSSVATSLCEGEAIEKKVFILNVNQKDYNLECIKLKTVRPFHMLEISLSKINGIRPGLAYKNEVTQFLIEKVENLIKDAHDEFKAENPEEEQMPLPLIRLRVDYSGGYEVENPRRFSNRFVGKVANVNSVVQFHKKDKSVNGLDSKLGKISLSNNTNDETGEGLSTVHVETLINAFLKEAELSLLPERGLNDAIRQFVDKEDKSALKEFVDSEMKSEVKQFMQNNNLNFDDDIKDILKKIKKERGINTPPPDSPDKTTTTAATKSKATTKRTKSARGSKAKSDDFVVDSDEDLDLDESISKPAPRSTRTKRSSSKSIITNSDEEANNDIGEVNSDDDYNEQNNDNEIQVINSDEDDDLQVIKTPSPPRKPTRGRGRGSRGARGSRGGSTRETGPKSTRAPARGNSKAAADTPVTDMISNLLSRKKK